jgi:phage-related protein
MVDKILTWLDGSGEVTFSNQSDHKYQASITNKIPFNRIIGRWRKFVVIFDCQPFRYPINDPEYILKQSDDSIIRAGLAVDPLMTMNPISSTIFANNVPVTMDCGIIEIDNDTYVNDDFVLYGNYMKNGNVITIYEATEIDINSMVDSMPVITVYGTGSVVLTINGIGITLNNIVDYVTVDSVLMDSYKDTVLKNTDMIGEFPVLKPGTNTISWTGNITKVDIQCNSALL